MASTWGKNLKITLWGESHSESIGVVVDGVPAGEKIDFDEILSFMERRKSSGNPIDTARKEDDFPEIQCGILHNYTCGTPICVVIHNKNSHSKDYSLFKEIARPSHADYTGFLRYNGFNDVRGGGHFSGRLTAGLVFAGGIALQILEKRGIKIAAHIQQISQIYDKKFEEISVNNSIIDNLNHSFFPVLDKEIGEKMQKKILEVKAENNSVGGIVECGIFGIEGGYGDPFFDSVESKISHLLFSIPAVKGVEFGDGFEISSKTAQEVNDNFIISDDKIVCETNHNGGILGGITNGMPIIFRCAFKPTPSISAPQKTVNFHKKEEVLLEISGRHDPCIVRRAVPVVEAAAAIAILDIILGSNKNWNSHQNP